MEWEVIPIQNKCTGRRAELCCPHNQPSIFTGVRHAFTVSCIPVGAKQVQWKPVIQFPYLSNTKTFPYSCCLWFRMEIGIYKNKQNTPILPKINMLQNKLYIRRWRGVGLNNNWFVLIISALLENWGSHQYVNRNGNQTTKKKKKTTSQQSLINHPALSIKPHT